ncbi:MAG TPA: hypothetical protein VK140_09715 [Ktedonobacteraceae bacterium]|nr:hypothetical protein [Ktedonobacteraceae bacterium]
MTWLHTLGYRLGQLRQQLGFVTPLSAGEYREVAQQLPSSAALKLFQSMSPADQRHALRVCRGLAARGCTDEDMLAAALLHDVGKAQGRVPFWTRPVIVLGKKLAPRLLAHLTVYPIMDELVGTSGSRRGGGGEDGWRGRLRRPGGGEGIRGDWESLPKWRRSLSYAWYHADVGADLAAAAGLSEHRKIVLYIRTHHQPNGPAAQLHEVDEVS